MIIAGMKTESLITSLIISLMLIATASCDSHPVKSRDNAPADTGSLPQQSETAGKYKPAYALLVIPCNPVPGEPFRIMATGDRRISEAQITLTGPSGTQKTTKSSAAGEAPYLRTDDFSGGDAGTYTVRMSVSGNEVSRMQFTVAAPRARRAPGVVWKTLHGWDPGTEALYSAWISTLFSGLTEEASWSSLNEVTQDSSRNFLYNYLSLDEDQPGNKRSVVMRPDCADNPFFLRAYFAWKLGLPFGYHICDRGSLGRDPSAGQWITNESNSSQADPVLAFNAFLRKIMDGVHSGTARTSLDNANSDYYPVPLESEALRPGTVYADPYGHTLVLVRQILQTRNKPGLLLSVDAQPDGTIGIKRFWKGNFLFNTSGVIGEPGFKAFRPIRMNNGSLIPVTNNELTESSGYVPFSMQQRDMGSDDFYNMMERIINPKPLDPEEALASLIRALHEQLQVRITSVANGEEYMKAHPGTVIPMPSTATGIFLAGGLWESFSTPNRDLRMLIAMDEVLGFPDRVVRSPGDYDIPVAESPEKVREKLISLLDRKTSELTVTYTRTDGSAQTLTVAELLKRRDAFEMGYNPNDGIEIRWGAPENSDERSTCKRHAPAGQQETMRRVREWFHNRLHPPT